MTGGSSSPYSTHDTTRGGVSLGSTGLTAGRLLSRFDAERADGARVSGQLCRIAVQLPTFCFAFGDHSR